MAQTAHLLNFYVLSRNPAFITQFTIIISRSGASGPVCTVGKFHNGRTDFSSCDTDKEDVWMALKRRTEDTARKATADNAGTRNHPLPQGYRDVSNQEIFKNHVLCAQF